MDVVGVEGEAAAGSAGGTRAVPAGPVGEWEREQDSRALLERLRGEA